MRAIRRSPRGFTLIELLVVISIIALLISILLPALQKARDQAKVTACLSQEHQIALGMVARANDYNGNLLTPLYYNQSESWCAKVNSSGNTNPDTSWFAIFPYISIPQAKVAGDNADPHLQPVGNLLYCPSAPGYRDTYGTSWQTAGIQYISYGNYCRWSSKYINSHILNGSPGTLSDTGDKVMFGDMTSWSHPLWRMHSFEGKLLGGNFAHLDGHAGWIPNKELVRTPSWRPTNNYLQMALPEGLR